VNNETIAKIENDIGLRVLVDDTRDMHADVTLRTASDARRFFANPRTLIQLYMDHDLGCVDQYGNEDDGYKVLSYILERGTRPEYVTLVTANPVGRDKMAALLGDYGYSAERRGAVTFTRDE